MKPPVPANEAERSRAVEEHDLVGAIPERDFDDLAKLASVICGTPVGLVTVVHRDMQYLKANVGFRDEHGALLLEGPRDESFCAHGLDSPDELMVVEDARLDRRFADNPAVTGHPGIRFYAGAPLVTRQGHVLGSLCVVDSQPRRLTEQQAEGLRILARQAQAQLDLRRMFRERERRNLELAQYAEIVQSSGDAILSKTPEGILRSWNPEAERLYGWTAEEMIGHSVRRLIPPEELASYQLILERVRRGERVEVHDVPRLRKDGTRVVVSICASPIRNGQGDVTAIIWIARDETERHRARKELEEALRLHVEANEQLRRSNEVRSNFVSTVSHEFRTPLTVVQGFSEMLATQEFSMAEVREYAADIHAEATRLSRLISDMLDLDRMESGRMRIEHGTVDLNAVLRGEAERHVSGSARHRLVLELDDALPLLEADHDRVRQVAVNLLSNAVKYSPAGGDVTVETRREGETAHVLVRDEGVGIAPEALERVFDRYARSGTTRDSAIQGTGLGLSIVRQIVQLHGGRVWAESGGSRGTTIHVVLPLRAAPPVHDDQG